MGLFRTEDIALVQAIRCDDCIEVVSRLFGQGDGSGTVLVTRRLGWLLGAKSG